MNNVVDDIFKKHIKSAQYTLQEVCSTLYLNSILIATKPYGTFCEDFIAEVLNRIQKKGYQVYKYVVLGPKEYIQRDILRIQYRYLFKMAVEGDCFFTNEDYKAMKYIYASKYKQYDRYKIIPAYQLVHKYGLTNQDVISLWCEGTQNPYYLKNDFRGVNKVGDHKYIFLTQDKRVNNGEHFYLLNGLAVQLDEEQKEQKEKLIAFVIVGNPRHSSTWKEMREEFLGDHAYPAYCPMGSIRYDAYSGIIKTNQKSENRNNVMHMSSGPLESLLEEMLWMQIPMENSVLGKTLFDSGFSKRDISNFLLNPTIRKQNETIDLFSLTEKMDMEELIDTLRTIRRYEKLPV